MNHKYIYLYLFHLYLLNLFIKFLLILFFNEYTVDTIIINENNNIVLICYNIYCFKSFSFIYLKFVVKIFPIVNVLLESIDIYAF